jgi:hypothetical protein
MQTAMWGWLFRRVPPEQHNQLALVTRSGTEIAIQVLLRIEPDFLVIKGRLSGSQDAGRVYFIPFANIDYFGLQRDVKETEFDAIFGSGTLTAPSPTPAQLAEAVAPPDPPPSVSEPSSAKSTSVSQKTPLPLKSEVLERFRSRIASSSPSLSGIPSRLPEG